MGIHTLSTELSVAPQVSAADLKTLREAGFRSVICNRPDDEGADQPVFEAIERAARDQGLQARYLPAESGKVSDEQGLAFGTLMAELPKPVLAFCRTGMRSTTMWALSQAGSTPPGLALPQIVDRPAKAGIAVAASLLARSPGLDIAIVDPADIHDYQPGWTLVGAGVFDLAPYTWHLVQQLHRGTAIFTQPPMPIKCAGAPQKAMYLSADHWRRNGVLGAIDIQFCNAGAVLFGVAEYVPALMAYIKTYGIGLNFGETLVAVDGPGQQATFSQPQPDGSKTLITREFDMLHVVPPQQAPDFIRVSPLADAAGWVDVDPGTLRHKQHANVYGLGDAGNTSNAKTAAAARKQAPVVAHNLLAAMGKLGSGQQADALYDGYGSCPLTVERGKIVLAEFTYGGKLAPSFPKWLIDGTKPSTLAWYLKERILPPLYWEGMLKGREWLAQPEMSN